LRYKRGHPELGQSPGEWFDCSGFVRYVLGAAGLTIPDYIGADNVRRPIRHANEFWDHYGVNVHPEKYTGGDLLFFSRNGLFPTHIGIVRDEESYIHAPGKDDTRVEIQSINTEAIVGCSDSRMLYAINPIGFKAVTVALENPSYRYHQRLAS
jgi:cell wall-associated NlpC family hydrolase